MAAVLWELLRRHDRPVEVSTPARSGRRKREGIRLHRCHSLISGTTTRRLGIPVTTPARTVADLRGVVPPHLWRRAVRQAEIAGFALGPEVEMDGTRSDLELDFLWRAARLVVETDSYRYHRGRIAFQDDHARELDLRARGFKVRRFDERQIDEEPAEVAADIAAALAIELPGWPTHQSSS